MLCKFKYPLLAVTFLLLCSVSCNDCNGEERIIDDIVSLQLNVQVCRDVSTFSARGLTIPLFSGTLHSAASGAAVGETSFEIVPVVALSPLAESPAGRSWFRLTPRAENLRPGEWVVQFDYTNFGGGDIHENVEVLAAGSSVYFTIGRDDASLTGFPSCP